MFFEFLNLDQLIFIIGLITIALFIGLFLFSLIIVFIIFYSIEKNTFTFQELQNQDLSLPKGQSGPYVNYYLLTIGNLSPFLFSFKTILVEGTLLKRQ